MAVNLTTQDCQSSTPTFDVKDLEHLLDKLVLDKLLPEITSIKDLVENVQERQGKTDLKITELESENVLLKTQLAFLESRLSEVEKRQVGFKERVLDTQVRSMQNNLVFYRIPEQEHENTKHVIMEFIVHYLKINTDSFRTGCMLGAESDNIYITKCHRFGSVGPDNAPRPIVAVFVEGKDTVLRKARLLAHTNFYITRQLPPERSEQKRKVHHIFKEAKAQGKKPRYVDGGEVVMVDNVKYTSPTIKRCTNKIAEIINNTPLMNIYVTQPVTDQGNKFIAHTATCTNPVEVSMAINAIKHTKNNGTSNATHNMYAARLVKDGKIVEYTEDDGEHGGARNILREMQNSNIANKVVVVSRWCSGTYLGRKRFNIITQCTKAAIHISYSTQTTPKIVSKPATPPDYRFASPIQVGINVRQNAW